MGRVYLLVVHDYDGYEVLHVFSDSVDADTKLREYIEAERNRVLENPKRYAGWAHNPNCTFNYEVLEFVVE